MALLGIDLGTSGVKALVIDEAGAALASATVEYPVYTPKPLWSEQKPAIGGRAPCRRFRGVGEGQCERQRHHRYWLSGRWMASRRSEDGNVIGAPAGGAMVELLRSAMSMCSAGGEDNVRNWVCNMRPATPRPRSCGCATMSQEHFAKLAHSAAKDYIRFRLSREYASEKSDATGTGLLSPKRARLVDGDDEGAGFIAFNVAALGRGAWIHRAGFG